MCLRKINQHLLARQNPDVSDKMLICTWNLYSPIICQVKLRSGGVGGDPKIMAVLSVVTPSQRVNSVSEDVTRDRADGVRNVSHVLSRSTFLYLEALIDEAIWASCVERYIRKETGLETRDAEIPVCAVTHWQLSGSIVGLRGAISGINMQKSPKLQLFPLQCQDAETPDELLDLTYRHALPPRKKS